jgi:hypothetical protein
MRTFVIGSINCYAVPNTLGNRRADRVGIIRCHRGIVCPAWPKMIQCCRQTRELGSPVASFSCLMD